MIQSLLLAGLLAGQAGAYDSIRLLPSVSTPQMRRPAAAVASDRRLFVLDSKKNALFLYDLSGRLVKSVGERGDLPGDFDSPSGLALGEGRVYVADTGNDRVEVFDRDGKFVSAFGVPGSGLGRLKQPRSVAVGADGRVYVADTGNRRVQVFTADGILLYGFGEEGKKPGQLKDPVKVAVDPADDVYVLDSGNGRIEEFGPSARLIKDFAVSGDDFVVDPYGFLYVLDAGEGRVLEVSPDGVVQGRFGSRGSGPAQFKKPRGLALTPDGQLLVVDSGNRRIDGVELSNKLKTAALASNPATKILISGPSRDWKVWAGPIAALGDRIYAYLEKEGSVVALDQAGKTLETIGRKGKGEQDTRQAGGLAADAKLGLFVADSVADRIEQFGTDGAWKANLAQSAGLFDSKSKEGRVKRPLGVAAADSSTIYVADSGNRRVEAFSSDGVFLFSIGPKVGALELQEPVGVAWDDQGRFLYILDRGLKKIVKCEPSGAFLAAWGGEGEGPGQFKSPSAIAFDGARYLFVLDSQLRRVSVYSAEDGRWMTDLLSGGRQAVDLERPVSLAIQGRRLVISDLGSGRIVSFDLHPSLAAPAAISTSSKEGIVSLSWPAVSDPWTAKYRVYRSTSRWSGYAEIGRGERTSLDDAGVLAYGTYYYRVATQAKTGDVGAFSPPVEVAVAGAFNRAPVEISSVTLGDVFPAQYKWYLKHALGRAVVTNNVNVPFEKMKLSFRLKDYMDFASDTEIRTLGPGQSVEIPLIATLNNKVLGVTEDTPIQAELRLTYFENGKQQEVSLTKPLRLYSRNAITWQDPARIADFITPNDPPVMDFQREVLLGAPDSPQEAALDPTVVTVMHLWDALSELGVKYFANPKNPFESVVGDRTFPVDYTQFPRETLKRRSGQCDDLTTLLASMLDADNVRAAVLDYPGHMALMFDTEQADAADAGLPADELIAYDGSYWVPVEPTLVGRPFGEAVRKAAYAYQAENAKGDARIIEVRRAWQTYEPVTMPDTDWTVQKPDPAAVAKRFEQESAELFKEAYPALQKTYEAQAAAAPTDPQPLLSLGLLDWRAGHKKESAEEFEKAQKADPSDGAAVNDLGNLAFLAGDYASAEKRYLDAANADPDDADIWMNLVRTAVKLKDKAKAQQYAAKAVAADPDQQPAAASLMEGL